ncbi:MAG: sulfate adenylyltransferase subunit CysN [Lentisphaerae bacterium]|nr:sulfate adenylyltransferase subunit CysN [Lentisphaerota bacterium]
MAENKTIKAFLAENEHKDLLRFSTAGSIDDGKSTLIGRLLHDSKNIYEDQIASVKNASVGRAGDEGIDFSLLTDGLKAEREQGITIDVAYRYFSTPRRKFIIADTPGHEQYTRNMATGSSTAGLSVVLVDARKGVLPQTKRHAFINSLLGVQRIIVAVNKMDAVGYKQDVFEQIRDSFVDFAERLRMPDVRFIPISALKGDNVVVRSSRMPWYAGESLLEILENVYTAGDRNLIDLRFPIQYALRPDQDFRGYCGQVSSGIIRKGDTVMVLPSMKTSRVKSIVTYDGELESAYPPMSVTVTLVDELDISRGDMLIHPHNMPRVSRQFEGMVVWMSETPMDMNRPYLIKQTTQMIKTRIGEVRYKVDVNTLNRVSSGLLKLNEIGRVAFMATRPMFYDPYEKNRATGCFIIVDPITNGTMGAGMIIDREPSDSLPPGQVASDISTVRLERRQSRISMEQRIERLGQKPATIWLTGLVGSGKTEIAYELEERLFDLGSVAIVLDGINLRLGVSRELDFSSAGTAEHLRRVGEIARLINDTGVIAICGFVSPMEAIRSQIAAIVGEDKFIEVHVDASREWCEQHDISGLYKRAADGEIRNLAGVNVPYEAPANPALVVRVPDTSVKDAAARILDVMRERKIL